MIEERRRILVTFLILFGVWLLFTFSLDPFSILLGTIFSFVIALFTADIFIEKKNSVKRKPFTFVFFLFSYTFVLLKEIYLASFYLLYYVITMNINPGIVKVKTGLTSNFGVALLANSITLTPGTVTIDVDHDNLYIHWLTVKDLDQEKIEKEIKGSYETELGRVFH